MAGGDAGQAAEEGEVFEGAAGLRAEFAALESALGDPETHADLASARRIGRRYAELTPIVKGMDEYERLAADLEAARELADHTPASRSKPRNCPPASTSSRNDSHGCSRRATPTTPPMPWWKSSPARAARSRPCSPATC